MRHRRKKLSGIIATLIIALFAWGYDHFVSVQNTPLPTQQVQTIQIEKIWTRGRQMSAAENARHHFQKHGVEFGFRTEEEYIAAAIKFTTEPLPDGVLKNIQKDNDTAYYNPKTAEYAVKSKKGLIRTYFKLNPKIHGYATNTEYFNAHAKVGVGANDNAPQK
jgi:hypothetical protein